MNGFVFWAMGRKVAMVCAVCKETVAVRYTLTDKQIDVLGVVHNRKCSGSPEYEFDEVW